MSNVTVTETVSKGIQQVRQRQLRKGERALGLVAADVKSDASSRLKWRSRTGRGQGGRATGRQADAICFDVRTRGGVSEARIGSGTKYGRFVEGFPKAPRKHYVPFKTAPGLRDWARHHGIIFTGKDGRARAAWRGKGMIVGGESSTTPFLEPAVKAKAPRMLYKMRTVMEVGKK